MTLLATLWFMGFLRRHLAIWTLLQTSYSPFMRNLSADYGPQIEASRISLYMISFRVSWEGI